MKNINDFQYEQLTKLLEKFIKNTIENVLDDLGVEISSFGTVSTLDRIRSNNNGDITKVERASVTLSTGEVIPNLCNVSGEILAVGDKVKIYGSRTNMSNRYIGVKYEEEVNN